MSPIKIQGVRGAPQGIIALQDIGGGLNLKSSKYTVPPNQAVKLQNAILVEDGSLLGRRGTLRFNAVSLGAGAVTGGTRAYVGAANHFLATWGTEIYKGTDIGGTFASSLTGLTNNSKSWFIQYLLFVYFANEAGDQPKKWDGTSWTNMGIAAPTGAATAAVGATGTPNGTYTFKYIYVTPTTESNPSPASNSVSPVNQKVDLTVVSVGPAGTTKRKIYGFKNGVSSVYQLIGEINDNVTTTFTVTTDQDSWTTTAPSTNSPPPAKAWITALFKNRLWKAGDSDNPTRLYFSQVFVPEAWPSTFFLDMPLDWGDRITALFVLGDLLLVFSDNQVFYIVGDTSFSFIVKRSFAQTGTPGPWAVDRVENTAVYLSRFAVNSFDGSQAKIISDPIEPQFTGIFTQFKAINYAQASIACLRYYDRLKAIAVAFPTDVSTTNDAVYWLYLRRQGWVKDSRSARLFIPTFGRGDTGDFFAFDSNAGILRQWDRGYTDDGANITMEYRSGTLMGDNPLSLKFFQWLTMRARPSGSTVNVTLILDNGVESDALSMILSSGGIYGTSLYGTGSYAPDFDDFDERIHAKMRGRGMAIDLVLSYSDQVQLSQLFLTYTPIQSIRRRVP